MMMMMMTNDIWCMDWMANAWLAAYTWPVQSKLNKYKTTVQI